MVWYKRKLVGVIALLVLLSGVKVADFLKQTPTLGATPIFSSSQVGSSTNAGDVLQTDGVRSTWVSTSTLGLSGSTYTATGTLLDLTGTEFSVNEGTLTNGKICTYVTGTGLVCDYTDIAGSGATTTINGYSGPDFTFSTSSDTNIGLSITGSGSTLTFTPSWIGTLASSRIASSSVWDTAYTDRLKWDGGSTGLTAATGRTSLGLDSMALLANTGSSTITTLGTITSGIWNGTAITSTYIASSSNWDAKADYAFGANNFTGTGGLSFGNGTSSGSMLLNELCFSDGKCQTSVISSGSFITLFHWNESSDLAGYERLRTTPNGGTEVAETATSSGSAYGLIDQYVSTTTDLSFSRIPGGVWNFHTYANIDSNTSDSRIVMRVYSRNAAGTETLLFTATSSEMTTGLKEYSYDGIYTGSSTTATTDRIVIKPYCWSNSVAKRTCTFYYDGVSNYSHVVTPFDLSVEGFTRTGVNETITGNWTFNGTTTLNKTVVTGVMSWFGQVFTDLASYVAYIRGLITENITGMTFSSGQLSIDAGYKLLTDTASTTWDTAYTDRLKWDGGSTGLVAATGRTSLGLGTMALEPNTGSTTITTLGTIGTGVWSGTAIADNKISSSATWSAKADYAFGANNFLGTGNFNTSGTITATTTTTTGTSTNTNLKVTGVFTLFTQIFTDLTSFASYIVSTITSGVTAGDGLTWSSSTLNFDGGNTPGGSLGGTWASPTIDDLFLFNNGDVGTGVFDFGGVTSFEIMNGSAPVLTTIGQVAVDTTSDQFRFYGTGGTTTLMGIFDKSYYIASTTIDKSGISFSTGTTTHELWNPRVAVTLTNLYCKTDTATTTLQCGDGTNWTEQIICGSSGQADDGSITNSTFTAREDFVCKVGSNVGTPNKITVTPSFKYTLD